MWSRARHDPRQIRRERVGFHLQLAPCDADRLPARRGKGAVARPVALEGPGRGVDRPAVELDDHTLCRPDAIALEAFDEKIDVRLRKAASRRPLAARGSA